MDKLLPEDVTIKIILLLCEGSLGKPESNCTFRACLTRRARHPVFILVDPHADVMTLKDILATTPFKASSKQAHLIQRRRFLLLAQYLQSK